MNKSILVVLITISTVLNGISQPLYFERKNPMPIETHLLDICKVPGTNRFFAVGSNASYMYTDDNSESWIVKYRPADIFKTYDLNSVCFVNENTGFIVGSNGTFLKSTDGGLNWEKFPIYTNSSLENVYFLDEQTGFIARNDTLMRTADGGINWNKIPIDNGSPWLFCPDNIHFINDTTGFFGNCFNSYFIRSYDTGITWDTVKIYHDVEDLQITDFMALTENVYIVSGEVSSPVSNSYHILRSEDSGHSWTEVYSNSFNTMENLYALDSLSAFAYGKRIMYDNMIVKTSDGGSSWEEVNMCGNYWWLSSMVFNDSGYGICVGSYGQVIESINFGDDWNINSDKPLGYSSFNYCVEITDNETAFIGIENYGGGVTSGGIYKSTNSGTTWDKILDSQPIISICFASNEVVVALPSYDGYIYISKNGGSTWDYVNISGYESYFQCVDMIDDQVGFVGGYLEGDRILKTIDCWETFHTVNLSDNIGDRVLDIKFINDSTGYAITDDPGYYLKSTNQGENWQVVYLEDDYELRRIHFVNENTGYLLGLNCLLKTIDGGNTWTYPTLYIPEDYYYFNKMDFLTTDTGFMVAISLLDWVVESKQPLLWTTDGGDSWQIYPYEPTTSPTDVAFFNDKHGLIVGDFGTVFSMSTFPMTDIKYKEEIDQNIINCYPNPANSKVHIESPDNTPLPHIIKVYNLSGQLISDILIMKSVSKLTIDVSKWEKGVYVLKPYSEGSDFKSYKLVVN